MAKLLGDGVNLLGLGAFRGGRLNPTWGAAIGVGVSGATMLGARHVAGSRHPELIGLGAGLAASTLMFTMKSTRAAAIAAAIGTLGTAGIAWLGKMMFGEATVPAKVIPPEVKGLGFPQARALNGLGIPTLQALNGLGYPAVASVPHAQGAIPGVAGSHLAGPGGGGPPVSLLGAPSAAQIHLLGIRGLETHGVSAQYGATLLGSGR